MEKTPAGAPPYATLLSFSRCVDRAGSAKATFVGSSRPARQSRSGFNPHNKLLKALKVDIQHGRRGEQLAIAAGMRCPAPVAAALRGPAGGRRAVPEVARLPAQIFLSLVADREGGQPGPAHEHTQPVLTTLRESVPDDQFYDVVLDLPNDYVDLLMPGGRAP